MLLKCCTALLIGLVLLGLPRYSFAEVKTIVAEATYIMGDGESPSFAETRAIQQAKQTALEQAGTYVESYTKTHNFDLTAEEIQTLAGGVLSIEILDKQRTLVQDGLRLYVKIRVTVTVDKMEELAQRIKGRNIAAQYKQLQEDFARLGNDIENWKRVVASSPKGPERDAALHQIREQEKAFSMLLKTEVSLLDRLVTGRTLVAAALKHKLIVDELLGVIKAEGHIVKLGQLSAHTSPVAEVKHNKRSQAVQIPTKVPQTQVKQPAQDDPIPIVLRLPMTITVAQTLPAILENTGAKLSSDADEVPTRFGEAEKMMGQRWVDEKEHEKTQWAGKGPNSYKHIYEVETVARYYELSSDEHLERYFQKGLSKHRLIVRFLQGHNAVYTCAVPQIVSRIFPVFSYNKGYFVADNRKSGGAGVLVSPETARIFIESTLNNDVAANIDRVTASFEDADIPEEICATTLK